VKLYIVTDHYGDLLDPTDPEVLVFLTEAEAEAVFTARGFASYAAFRAEEEDSAEPREAFLYAVDVDDAALADALGRASVAAQAELREVARRAAAAKAARRP
jgi:hypothetical protein